MLLSARWRCSDSIGHGLLPLGERSKVMTFRQRLAGLLILFVSVGDIITAVSPIALSAVILSNQPLVTPSVPGYIRKLLILVSVLIMVDWLDTYVVSFSTGYRIAMRDSHRNLWIAPYMPLPSSSFRTIND